MTRSGYLKSVLAGGVSAIALATGAWAEDFNVPSGDLKTALNLYATQARVALIVSGDTIKGARTKGASGDLTAEVALARILEGTGLTTRRTPSGAIGVVRENATEVPVDAQVTELAQAAQAKPAAAAGIESVLVTAQKKTEDIQTVPIAVTALSSEQLQAMKVEGGPDLLKEIPNMSFTKTNFSGYNIQIRGIGTQAVSVTTDPAVAVAFNSTAFIRNRFFEQEFFDVQDVEVLRGPQGTLYGRNATAGVVNIVSAKPTDEWEGMGKVEVGNYNSRRLTGTVNIPIDQDKLDLRVAGAWTKRDGYDFNTTTGHPVNGRDLWSSRATLGFKPFEWLHGDLVWEHFNERDNRSRTGKQLCHHDAGPQSLDDITNIDFYARAWLSQGCSPGSLYDAGAFGTPNGLSLPFVLISADSFLGFLGTSPQTNRDYTLINQADPYGNMMQSTNLHDIASIRDPKFRAKNDIFEFNFDADVTPELTVTSQTGYNKDIYYSTQDYNRFNTVPIFNDSTGLLDGYQGEPMPNVTPGGVFCDPQIGCSNSIAGFDISQAKSWQFSQEVRLASNFSGPLNFSAGANYTHYRTVEDYYVLFNLITAFAELKTFLTNGSADPTMCSKSGSLVTIGDPGSEGCIYIDPNPLDQINGQGHNYFRSDNPYTLNSLAGFAEAYYQVATDLKVIAGLRYTDDNKRATPVPSQLLLSTYYFLAGTVDRGYPALPDIKQHWGEFTGRLNAEWTPKVDFTDQTMFYASYSRGYKGGGANPPGIGFASSIQILPYPATFKPEFVNAYELGTKNTLVDGTLTLNGDVFYYDYKDYQISQIIDRTAVNQNFNAKVWGSELEATWEPLAGLRFNFAGGYENSRVDNNQFSIDLMNRTQGNPNYVTLKPFPLLPSNCVVSKTFIEQLIAGNRYNYGGGEDFIGMTDVCPGDYLSFYDFNDPAFANQGLGFPANVGGNQLPNTPHFTMSFGAQYGMPITDDWSAVMRGDFYWQDRSFARIYNDHPYDVLHPWSNANVSLAFVDNEGWQVEAYVKNVFDKAAITGDFLNSDDSGLTTNIFTTDPRLIGLSITKNL